MSLPDIDIDKELIDPTDPEPLAAMAGGFGEPRKREEPKDESLPQDRPEKPPQMARTSNQIQQHLHDIAKGHHRGHWPVVDSIVDQDPERYAHTVCNEDCPNRQAGQRLASPPLPPPQPMRLISDVRPSMKERVAVVEHEVVDLNRVLEQVKASNAVAASKDEVHWLDKRIDSAHARMDRDFVKGHGDRLDRLERKRVGRDYILVVALIISVIGNIITLYKLFGEA